MISAPYFYESPPAVFESIHSVELQTLINYGLSTNEGRSHFLETKLLPFINEVDQLIIDIQALTDKITEKFNYSAPDQTEILALSKELESKHETISPLLPILEMTLMLETDFEYLDQIISKTSPLNEAENDILKRVVSLCNALTNYNQRF